MTDRRKQLSLRKFRDAIADIREVVEVSRRDTDGNIQILGFWTPYVTHPAEAKPYATTGTVAATVEAKTPVAPPTVPPAPLEFPVSDDDEFDRHPLTAKAKVIKTPEEAAVAVATNPVRAVPKPSQKKASR